MLVAQCLPVVWLLRAGSDDLRRDECIQPSAQQDLIVNLPKQRLTRYLSSLSELCRPHDGSLPFCRRVGRALFLLIVWMVLVSPAQASQSVAGPTGEARSATAPPSSGLPAATPSQPAGAGGWNHASGAWRGTTSAGQIGTRPAVARYVPRQAPYYSPAPPRPSAPPAASPPSPDAVDAPPSPPFFDLAVATQFPLSIGGQATLELPGRLLAQLEVGAMPESFGSAIAGMLSEFGGANGEIRALANSALEQALVVRVSGGWRPFSSAGFEVWAGYTSASLSGAVTFAEVAAVVDNPVTTQLAGQLPDERLVLDAQLHNFHLALGWRWLAFEHLSIRANLGYTQTLSSTSSINIEGQPEATALATAVVDRELGALYKSYVKLPTLGVSVGYRF